MTLQELKARYRAQGCTNLYAKPLAPNDNSKNQIYFGPDFTALTLFPNQGVYPDSSPKNLIFKARLDFAWLDPDGNAQPAPGAQLILYPQYPEVRFSGFLRNCSGAPSELLNQRLGDRVLFLGVTPAKKIFGFVAAAESQPAIEFRANQGLSSLGVFFELALLAVDNRVLLLQKLCRINRQGWIDSKRLKADGTVVPCSASNCGGYTLEAELGVCPNARAEPDFLGYEVKQHSVLDFHSPNIGIITLMTPEPTGGVYCDEGPVAFLRRYGYQDKKGRLDRVNFGGIFRTGKRHQGTGLTLMMLGYGDGVINNDHGSIALIEDTGVVAASWGFSGLMQHWTRKHAHAVYVPSQVRMEPLRQYRYGDRVRIAEQPDFLHLLDAFAAGIVYYDPGLKLESESSPTPRLKRRSQFRIRSADLRAIYRHLETVEVCAD